MEGSEWAFTATFAGQAFAVQESHRGQEIDVYDSAALTHMSPDRHPFISFKEIPSQPIVAADKTIFNATGVGNMCISIPNGTTANQVTVKDVLYCLELAFTLVLLAQCDKAGATS